jgi:hypothetical protein
MPPRLAFSHVELSLGRRNHKYKKWLWGLAKTKITVLKSKTQGAGVAWKTAFRPNMRWIV